MKQFHFFGISMTAAGYQEFFTLLKDPAINTLVFTPNPEIFVRASRDQEFMNILKKATYNVPDGVGLYLGYELASGKGILKSWYRFFFCRKDLVHEYGELIKGSDLAGDILENKKGEKQKILIIDKKITEPRNELEVKKQALQKNMKTLLEEKYSGVEIFVIFDGEMSPDAIAHFIEINQIQYVLSCLGMKTQEKRLVEIFDYLPNYTRVVGLGVGASIDFLMGIQKRAPLIFQKFGLEWLYRLMTQPRIRAKRIYDAVVEFPRMVRNVK